MALVKLQSPQQPQDNPVGSFFSNLGSSVHNFVSQAQSGSLLNHLQQDYQSWSQAPITSSHLSTPPLVNFRQAGQNPIVQEFQNIGKNYLATLLAASPNTGALGFQNAFLSTPQQRDQSQQESLKLAQNLNKNIATKNSVGQLQVNPQEYISSGLKGTGVLMAPAQTLTMGAINVPFQAATDYLTNKITGQPTPQRDLSTTIAQGIDFGAQLNPLSKATGVILSPILSKINPAEIKTGIDVIKRLTASNIQGGVGFGAYGGLQPAKDPNERLNNIKDYAIQGALFDMGITGGGLVVKQLVKNIKIVISEYKKMTPEQQSEMLQRGGIKINNTSPFTPTKDWQPYDGTTAVPLGGEIRPNPTTGLQEIRWPDLGKVKTQTPQIPTQTPLISIQLPRDLQGAKPKYGYGSNLYDIKFASDIDKSLYIVAKSTPSARDGDYMKFLQSVFPDMSSAQIRQMGQDLKKNVIKPLAANGQGDTLNIPITFSPRLSTKIPSVIDTAYTNTIKNGGVTIDISGKQPKTGYSYSPYPELQTIIPQVEFTPQHMLDFQNKNIDVLSQPGHFMGGWVDESTGQVYLDVSIVSHDLASAMKDSIDKNQLALYNIKTGEDILTPLHPDYGKKIDVSNLNQGQNTTAGNGTGVGGVPEIPTGTQTVIGTDIPTTATAQGLKATIPSDNGLPLITTGEQAQRGLITSIQENPKNLPGVRAGVSGKYDMTSDAGRIAYGQEYIKQNFEDAKKRILSPEPLSNELQGIGLAMFKKAQTEGRVQDAVDIGNAMAEKATENAQVLQFFHVWSQSTPKGMIDWAKNLYDQANQWTNLNPKRFVGRVFGKEYKLEVTPAMEKRITDRMGKIQLMPDGTTKDIATQKLIADIAQPIQASTMNLIDAYRYQNMLSGLRTQEKNLFGNLFNGYITRPATMAMRPIPDLFASVVQGKDRQYYFKEIPTYYKGMFDSFASSIEAFKDGFRGGLGANKNFDIKNTGFNTISNQKVPMKLRIFPGLMEGTDRFFQTMIGAGIKASELSKGTDEATANRLAEEGAKYSLYRAPLDIKNVNGQGSVLSFIDKGTNAIINARGNFGPLGWFIPFIRMPMSLAKQWLEFNPVTGLATLPGAKNKSEQVAKMMLGAVVYGMGAMYAAQGRTTWAAPTDPKAKELFYATNRKPFSMQVNVPGVGDVWVPMMYLGPFALAMAIPAAMKYNQDESKTALTSSTLDKATNDILQLVNFWSQTTPLSSLSGFVQFAQGDQAMTTAKNLAFNAGQVIPFDALLSNVAKIIDPIFRKSTGFIQGIEQNIPNTPLTRGFNSTLLPAYTKPNGDVSQRNITDFAAPFTMGKVDNTYEGMYQQRNLQLQQNAVQSKINSIKQQVTDGTITLQDGSNQVNQLLGNVGVSTSGSAQGNLSVGSNSITDKNNKFIDTQAKFQVETQGGSLFQKNKIYYADPTTGTAKIIDLNPLLKPTTGMDKYTQQSDMFKTARDIYANQQISAEQKTQAYKTLNVDPAKVQYDYFANQPTQPTIGYFMDALQNKPKDEIIKALLIGRTQSISGSLLTSDAVITGLAEQGLITRDEAKYLKTFKFTDKGTNVGSSTVPKAAKKLSISIPKVKATKIKLGSARTNFKPLKPFKTTITKTPSPGRIATFKPTAINLKIKKPAALRVPRSSSIGRRVGMRNYGTRRLLA